METYLPELTVPGILGFLAPLLVAVVNQPRWSARVRRVMAIVVSLALAVVALFITGALNQPIEDPRAGMVVILAVIGVAQVAYALLWKPTGAVQAVEEATTVDKGKHEAD